MFDYVIEMFQRGGVVLVPIIISSLIGWFYAIHLWMILNQESAVLVLFRNKKDTQRFSKNQGPTIRAWLVLKRMSDVKDNTLAAKKDTWFESHEQFSWMYDSWLSVISVMAVISPLLGLLGTVTGIIHTFEVISVYGTGSPELMSDSIGEALMTTQYGILAAFPLMLLHVYLYNKTQKNEVIIERLVIDEYGLTENSL